MRIKSIHLFLVPQLAHSFLVSSSVGRNTPLLHTSTTSANEAQYTEASVFEAQTVAAVISNDFKSASNDFKSASIEKYENPAEYERIKFQCDDSVEFWHNFNKDSTMEDSDFLRIIYEVSNRFVDKGPEAVSYWLRHMGLRTGYFISNVLLVALVSQFQSPTTASSESTSERSFIPLASVAEVALTYEQDYKRILEKKYKAPYDMYKINRQFSPLFFGQQTFRLVKEGIAIMKRSRRGSDADKSIWMNPDVESELYPAYYKNAFHYQTDGWMSHDSASVYEMSTETLFLGRQDSMQRTALIPLVRFANRKRMKMESPLKILEIACGTGRFMTFARDNLPLDTKYTALDLSPFYLNQARENDKNWISIRKSENRNAKIEAARMVQAKAEALPFMDEEFDAVICIYLYHEIPRDVRAKASKEMARVVKKGGRIILTDSFQKGDIPVKDDVMGNFGNLNEPYYTDYIEDFLPLHFEKAGMVPLSKYIASSTKTLAFEKPIKEDILRP